MIGCTIVISISTSCSRHCFITLSSWLYDLWTHVWWMIAWCTFGIYSVNTFLYPYALPIDSTLYTFSSLCLSCNLVICQVHSSRKHISIVYSLPTIKVYLFCNMPYSSAVTIWVFHLPWWRYSYSTWSSMTELLLSVSQHWNLHSG